MFSQRNSRETRLQKLKQDHELAVKNLGDAATDLINSVKRARIIIEEEDEFKK